MYSTVLGTCKHSLNGGYHHHYHFLSLKALVAASRNCLFSSIPLFLTTTIKEHFLRILEEILCFQVLALAGFRGSVENQPISPLTKPKLSPTQGRTQRLDLQD